MNKPLPCVLAVVAALFAGAAPAFGQSVLTVSAVAGGQTSPIAQGGTLALTATDLGQPVLANVTVRYTGTATASITRISVAGTSEVTLSGLPNVPLTLNPGQTTTFLVQYLPSSGNSVTGQVTIAFTESGQSSSFQFAATGTSPHLTFSYFFAPNGSLTDLNPGDRITFPPTNVGATSQASLTILNRGSAAASLQTLTLSGPAFQLTGSPAPAQLPPGQQVSFTVTYAPQSTGGSQGIVTLGFASGTVTFTLIGTGTSASFALSYTLANGNISPLPSGAAINFPSVDVNGSTTATVTVLNQGTGSGTLTSVTVSGAGFQLSGLPLLPATIPGGQSLKFGIVFSPTQAGAFNGSFSIVVGGSTTSGTLTGSASTANLSASYTVGTNGNINPLASGSVINFPSVDVNGSVTANITIVNQGTGSGTVNSITVSGAAFQLSGLPLLPATIPAGQSLKFGIVFNPTQTGTFNGTFGIALAGTTISGTLTGTTSASNFTASYVVGNSNSNSLFSGSVISFPAVDVNGTVTATVTIANQGPGTGTVSGISVSGAAFQLSGAPPFPATVPNGQRITFGIVFAPTQTGSFTGTFAINLSGSSISGTLTGSTASPNFSVSYTLPNLSVVPVSNGGTINFPAGDINTTNTITISVLNQGAGTGTVTGIFASGTGYQLSGVPLLPATVPANQSLKFGISFTPPQAGTFNGTFRIDLNGTSISGSLTGSTAPSNISLSYLDPDTNNVISLSDGSTLSFPNTSPGATSVVTVVATNSGTGTGLINSITAGNAAAFQLLGLPAFPISVAPSQPVRFGVRFSPQQPQAYTASMLVSVNGQNLSINLAGQATSAQYTYSVTSGDNTTPLLPDGTLAIADTTVGQSSSLTISITNTGSADGQISAIAATGAGLALANLPVVPFTLHANGSQQFTLTFTPTDPGPIKGRLTIGSDNFNITVNGIGPKLSFTYTNTAATNPVTPGGTVIFSPSAVGASNSLTFSIQNTGTGPSTVSSISLANPGGVFALQQLPSLPISLKPDATVTLTISFLPTSTGFATNTLIVDTNTFVLSGTGTPPAPLPGYRFTGPSGNQPPAQQPSIGLTLSSAYALPLRGTITLTFVSSVFTDDPAVQFANGSRTINFTIAANSTQALFNGNTTVPFQTGTTAGTIVFTPSFAMQTSGFDLTPPSPDTLNLTIARAAPQLLSANITSVTVNTFSVVLAGYSTSHNLRQLDIQIAPKQGSTFSSSHLTIDVTASSSAWFQSNQPFGGAFQITIPFTLQNGSADDLVHLLQSLTITMSNDVGTSNSLTAAIP